MREKSTSKDPLAMGLIGHKSGLIYAQMEISLTDYNTLNFAIRREPYSNLPNIEFSINNMDLEDIIDILKEAKKQLDARWLSSLTPRRDEISTQLQNQKEEKKNKEELAVRPPEKKEKGSTKCAHYLGYLANRPIDLPFPQECLDCPKVLDCAMKKTDS